MLTYTEKYHALENECNAYKHKAEIAFEENDFVPSKEQFQYLVKALQLRNELVKISIGETKIYQQSEEKKLTEEVNKVWRQVDPEGYERRLMEKRRARANAIGDDARKKTENAKPSREKSGKEEISEEIVREWFRKKPEHGFENVAGMKEVKATLQDCAMNRKYNELKTYLKMPTVHSYFFYGPPGCGKTHIIQAFAHELMDENFTYLYADAAKIISSLAGVAEKKVDRLFEEAIKNAPSILFIDEVDSVCRNRQKENLADHMASITASFLTAYNKLSEVKKPVIFIGATNNPDQVDAAMLDRVELIYVGLPDAEARSYLLEMKMGMDGKVSLEEGFSYKEMSEKLDNFSVRDINRLVDNMKRVLVKSVTEDHENETTIIDKLKNGELRFKREYFEKALKKSNPTPKDDILDAMKEWRAKVENSRSRE